MPTVVSPGGRSFMAWGEREPMSLEPLLGNRLMRFRQEDSEYTVRADFDAAFAAGAVFGLPDDHMSVKP